jgi:arabinogalactan oligomer / maltooligosaccharide transport system substrate-binding protein
VIERSSSDGEGSGSGGGASGSGSEGGVSLTIWADDKYSRAIKDSAAKWGAENDVKVNVQAVSKDLQTVFVTASQAGKGPDLVMGAHDWIGNLFQNGARGLGAHHPRRRAAPGGRRGRPGDGRRDLVAL